MGMRPQKPATSPPAVDLISIPTAQLQQELQRRRNERTALAKDRWADRNRAISLIAPQLSDLVPDHASNDRNRDGYCSASSYCPRCLLRELRELGKIDERDVGGNERWPVIRLSAELLTLDDLIETFAKEGDEVSGG